MGALAEPWPSDYTSLRPACREKLVGKSQRFTFSDLILIHDHTVPFVNQILEIVFCVAKTLNTVTLCSR